MALSSTASVIRRYFSLGLLAVALLAQGVFVAWTASGEKPHATWERLISTPIWPAYADLRVVTGGWDEVAAGFDPLRLDGDAPLYNYPRLWLAGGRLGGSSNDAVWLGAVIAGLFLAAVFAVLKNAPGWTRVLALGVLASPAVWLGLERGNTDLLLFALMTPALLASSRPGGRGAWAPFAILLAALLKYYPVVALVACWPRASRARRWLIALVGLLFVAYLAGTRTDVLAALAKTVSGTQESYGVSIAAEKFAAGWSAPDTGAAFPAGESLGRILRVLVLGLIAATGLAALRPAWRSSLPRADAVPEAASRLFLGGAAIYLATLLLGHNWAYRLIFLLWTLPFLGHVVAGGSVRLRGCAGLALGLIVFLVWQVAGHGIAAGITAQLASLALIFPLAWLGAGLLWLPETAPRRSRTILVGTALAAASVGCIAAGAGSFSRPMDEAWRLAHRAENQAQEGQLAEAAANFEAALRLWPEYADGHDKYAVMLWSAGRSAEAVVHFERAIELAPSSAGARNHLGAVRRSQRLWSEAIALHQAALAIRPGDAATHNQLGTAYLGARRPAEALAEFQEASRIQPDNALTERNLGLALANAGRPAEAPPHFERALQLSPDYADAEIQWGIVLAGMDRLPEAVVHLEHAIVLDPQSAPAHFFAAVALRQLGRPDEAEAHHREAVRLDPSLGRR